MENKPQASQGRRIYAYVLGFTGALLIIGLGKLIATGIIPFLISALIGVVFGNTIVHWITGHPPKEYHLFKK